MCQTKNPCRPRARSVQPGPALTGSIRSERLQPVQKTRIRFQGPDCCTFWSVGVMEYWSVDYKKKQPSFRSFPVPQYSIYLLLRVL